MDRYLIIAINFLLLAWTTNCESLTFLGGGSPADSMAIYRGWNAREKGTLNFQFKTSKQDGLLLYMHGRRKRSAIYIKLWLEMSRLSLAISYSSEENTVKQLGRDLHDSNWHNVTLIRNHRTTVFELDGTQRIIANLHWNGILEVTSDLYVGNTLDRTGSTGFIGCIKDLKYAEGYKELIMQPLEEKGINTLYGCYNYCDRDSTEPRCNSGTCLNRFTHYECDCFGTGYEGKYCEEKSKIISLRSNMAFTSTTTVSVRSIRSNKVQVRFKTVQKDGILLTIGKSNDFFTLEIYQGYIRIETNVGGGNVVLESDRPVHDGLWHDVEIKQNGAKWTMIVDSKSIHRFELQKPSPYGHGDSGCLGGDIAYFGGHFNPITAIGSKSKQGFVGCLQQFYFNSINVIESVLKALDKIKQNNQTHTDPRIDGTVDRECTVVPTLIKDLRKPQKTKRPTKKLSTKKRIIHPTIIITSDGINSPDASSIQQNPEAGSRNAEKLQKSSVAWITAGLVIGALVIILVMAFLVHRFRKKYRGTFMAPRDENGMPYYSSVQATYQMQNGVGKRHGRGNATDV